ncbi:MAG: hypothetical protein Q9209_000367 [Squamulea sp. 1 TL-2023]
MQRFYLEYLRNNLTYHHYFFRHNASFFLHHILVEQALSYEPLLYAVIGFAAFQATLRKPNGKIQDFLGYYNRSVSLLRKSLASSQTHTDATLLTILQLATIEEYLGDWPNLLGHQKAAYSMLTELYSVDTITENELRRKVLAWYSRFDLFAAFMSGDETALGREWFVASERYHSEQAVQHPESTERKLEAAVAIHRLVAIDMVVLFAKMPHGAITFEQCQRENQLLAARIRNMREDLEPFLSDDRYVVASFEGAPERDDYDIVDPYQPGGLRQGPHWPINFLLLDWLGTSLMHTYQTALILQQQPPPDLLQLALEICRLFEAIQYWPGSIPGSMLSAQAALGIAVVFLPKDERHTTWCRRKLAAVESQGYTYPPSLRGKLANLWGLPELRHWWLPNEEGYPSIIRSIRAFIEDRAGNQSKAEDVKDFSNQIIRKRKRKTPLEEAPADDTSNCGATISPETSTASTVVPTKQHDGGKKPRRTTNPSKSKAAAPPILRRNSSTLVESSIPWPDEFTRLEKTHRALNLVYTFCCTRKHLATTFETIRKAVEGHINRELLIEDVACIKALIPKAINFAFVDETSLQVAVLGEEDGIKGGRAKEFRSLDLSMKDDGSTEIGQDKELLLFEFIDGDLKRQVTNAKTGEPTKPFRKLREEDLKMPVYSQKQMMKLIEKRNTKFTSAINAFLNDCAAKDNTDAVQALLALSEMYIPISSESQRATPAPAPARPPPTIPRERQTIPEIVGQIKSMDWYTGQIVPDGHRVFDPQPPVFGDLKFELTQNLVNALYNTRGITQLYSHQAEAINNLYDGYNVIVATSTSSGKSLIYQVPMLHELEHNPNARGMYIFPTKALAQDQRRSMKEMLRFMPGLEETIVDTFDGDTAMADRNIIKDDGRIIFTNPDMLHITILPQEDKWRTFLQNLRYVVVDELHVYNGLFGSHVAFIMRRLRRICAAVGNRHVKFISCSATVANPEEHVRTIFGVDNIKLTDFDGSPSGRKEFLCWNTPFKDPGDPSSGRGDTMAETARLFCQLILRGVRVIAFCRVRKQCEILITAVRNEAAALERQDLAARVMGYRGGYSPQDRRNIEKEMFDGKLMGIIATNALELGVDIGSLDAVITVGFPYTIANLRQQSGRAGRRNKDSLSVLVGDCFATDQYYMDNPDEIFTKPNCELQVDLTNMLVLEGHIQCAAFEMPIRPDEDTIYFGKQLPEIAEERMVKDPLNFYHCNDRFRPHPSKCVAIRDTEDSHFAVVDITNNRNTVLEEVEPSRAFFTIYEGGIFLHQGHTYLVREFSPDKRIAKVTLVKVDWTTQQRDYTDVDPIETEAIRRLPLPSMSRAFYGAIKIHQLVFGFFKVDKKRRILDAVQVDNPPIEIYSKGLWLDVPKRALEILDSRRLNVAAAIHAAEHAILSLMPQFVISMPGDVRTECKVAIKEFAKKETSRKRPARLTFYDAKGGASGSGISTKAFEFIDLLLVKATERVGACHCAQGCVECVCSERCKEMNVVMSKAGSEVILKCLLGREGEIDVEALPWGPDDERAPAGIETVVAALEVPMAKGVREVEGRGVVKMEFGDEGVRRGGWGREAPIVIKDEPED